MRQDAIIEGFWICQVSKYASVAQGSEYAWIRMNNALWQGFDCLVNVSQLYLQF